MLDERDLTYQPYRILALTITWPLDNRTVYEAVSGNWNMNIERAKKADIVLAVYKGEIIGIFKPEQWIDGEPTHPKPEGLERHWVKFTGTEVTDPDILKKYLNKKLMKKIGEANPVRYFYE